MALTPEQTVAMAIEADCRHVNMHGDRAMAVQRLERFADLVAAKEREAIASHYEAQPHVEFFGRELADEIRARGTP